MKCYKYSKEKDESSTHACMHKHTHMHTHTRTYTHTHTHVRTHTHTHTLHYAMILLHTSDSTYVCVYIVHVDVGKLQTSRWMFRAVGPHQCSAAQQNSYQTTLSHTNHQHPLHHQTCLAMPTHAPTPQGSYCTLGVPAHLLCGMIAHEH